LPNQDLATNVAELCEQGRGEAALELVRTDLRNISQPLCTDIMLAFAEAGRSDCAQAALLHMQTLCVETGAQVSHRYMHPRLPTNLWLLYTAGGRGKSLCVVS